MKHEQMSLLSLMTQIHAGDIVHTHGMELTWEKIEAHMGGLVVMEHDARKGLQVVELMQVCLNQYGRKQVIYSNNAGLIGYVDRAGIVREKAQVRFYEI